MTRIFAFRGLAAVSFVTLAAGLSLFAASGTANARNVLKCDGADRWSVVECCETIVMKKGLPLWMKQTGRNCESSVKCTRGDNQRRCWVYNPNFTFDNSTGGEKHRERRQRDTKSYDLK